MEYRRYTYNESSRIIDSAIKHLNSQPLPGFGFAFNEFERIIDPIMHLMEPVKYTSDKTQTKFEVQVDINNPQVFKAPKYIPMMRKNSNYTPPKKKRKR